MHVTHRSRRQTIARVMTILHLCIVFTAVAASAGYPFMRLMFEHKTDTYLVHDVLGEPSPGLSGNQERLERNKTRFQKLPQEKQIEILSISKKMQERSSQPFLTKLKVAIQILAFQLPPFERAWILFSVIIGLLLLLHIQGAASAVWLIPCITLLYGVDNQWNAPLRVPSVEEKLLPTEQFIIEQYLQEPLNLNVLEQYQQLRRGWELYLIKEWAHEIPSKNRSEFSLQLEQGEYLFNLARALALKENDFSGLLPFRHKEQMCVLLAYLLWNLLFAYSVARASPNNVEVRHGIRQKSY